MLQKRVTEVERRGIPAQTPVRLKEKEVTYVSLVKRFKKHGFTETEAW